MIKEMAEHGLIVDELILDGQIHRCRVEGKTAKNGWYVGRGRFLTFGRWDTGLLVKSGVTERLTPLDRAMVEFIRAQTEQKHKRAANTATKLWVQGMTPKDHPYLEKKRISGHGIKQHGNCLIVPMLNSDGDLVNIQRIFPDGQKRFLYGGKVSGTASAITNPYIPKGGTVCICEGYATASTIYEATGHKTLVCFNAGNMANVAIQVRSKYPDAKIIICADSDEVGRSKGAEAAQLCNGDLRVSPEPTDFNDLFVKTGDIYQVANVINLPSNIVICEESKEDDLTLQIPPKVLSAPGLIQDGLKACERTLGIVQYNYPTVISLIARAISGRISYDNRHPVFYNLKVGGTSTGKTQSARRMMLEIKLKDFFGPSDFASGPGLLRALEDQPCCLIYLDEASYFFKRFDKPDQISSGKVSAILELYTATGTTFRKVFASKKDNIKIENPCVNILGNATPTIFTDLRPEDFETGLLQRWDFWYYGGPILHRTMANGHSDKFVEGLTALYNSRPKLDLGQAVALEGMEKRLHEYSVDIIDRCNALDNEGDRGLLSRAYDNAIKYALIHVASSRDAKDIYEPLTEQDIEYGIMAAEMLSNWKIKTLKGNVHHGKFHAQCELFKAAVRAGSTLAVMINRRPALKNLSPKEIEDIERSLVAQGELFIDRSRRVTKYHLLKNTENT